MRLIYSGTDTEVKIGDIATLHNCERSVVVESIQRPHKPSSTGRINVIIDGYPQSYFPSVINAEWIEREDQD